MVPVAGLIDHVTEVSDAPLTAALNCFVSETVKVAVDGETDSDTGGFSVTMAVPDFVGSATLDAFTVTV